MKAIRCVIKGRVQGVWFRDSTRRVAEPLGIRGSAINLADGSVEVVACGTEEALAKLNSWLHQGPPQARVDEVQCQPCDCPITPGFEIG
jgi:acylphosphatase